jgi:hypothetical protein
MTEPDPLPIVTVVYLDVNGEQQSADFNVYDLQNDLVPVANHGLVLLGDDTDTLVLWSRVIGVSAPAGTVFNWNGI